VVRKNIIFILALCTFAGSLSIASDETEKKISEVVSELGVEQLEQLLNTIDSEEFIAAVQKAVDAMVEKSKIAADAMIEKSKIEADVMVERSKVTAEKITQASKEFGVEAAKEWVERKKKETNITKYTLIKPSEKLGSEEEIKAWGPILWALISLYAAKTLTSIITTT
jgi:hypothetical protein